MESDIICEAFKQSIEKYGLIYKTLIADGDSSVYQTILDNHIYETHGVIVEKIECINHLFRNIGTKYANLSTSNLSHTIARGEILEFRSIVKNRAIKFRKTVLEIIEEIE